MIQIDGFPRPSGEWLSGEGPYSNLVISSRIRLARNFTEYPFTSVADGLQKAAVADKVLDCLQALRPGLDLKVVHLDDISQINRLILMERHLISREHAIASGPRLVAYNGQETISLMANEEDHLRLQVVRSGYQLEDAWQEMEKLERSLDGTSQFAFDDQFGYLTACPTNVGTGMRASVMLHLPALVITRQIEKVFQAATKINLAVRGFYGEGTQALGDFYQISNQRTLGVSEQGILANISALLPNIINYEKVLRRELLDSRRDVFEDKIWRAFGALANARVISSKETMELLSLVRLGVALKIIDNIELRHVNEVFLFTQPGHLQAHVGRELHSQERDVQRAVLIRNCLADLP
ncbi:MAG TPA: protein arginine kinase [Planctomycetes bacterium]|nr:protein arginine kinase [Planctomycetota bacterium]